MQSSNFEACKLSMAQLSGRKDMKEGEQRGTGAEDWGEAAMERVRERGEKERFGEEGQRVKEKKGRVLWPFRGRKGETLPNGVTMLFMVVGSCVPISAQDSAITTPTHNPKYFGNSCFRPNNLFFF